jgi:hypothetical protein
MHTETITWFPVDSGQLPDAELTVLVETKGCAEPVWLGYFDGTDWLDIEGTPITVVSWAEMPKGGGASPAGVPTCEAPSEIIGWQWRRAGQPWPEKMLSIEPALTAPDTEKRAIYAGPTVAYGVATPVKGQQ